MLMAQKPLDVDWTAIEAEYIGGQSLTTIATAYGISRSTVAGRARRGKWEQKRGKAAAFVGLTGTARNGAGLRLLFASEDTTGDPVEDITNKCLRIVKTGLDRIEVGMAEVDPKDAGTIRSYCSSLRDLQTVAGAFAGMTRAEIAARIEQIQRQRQIDEEYGTGVVMIPSVEPVEPVEVLENG
jgi:hypothetical protein